MSLNAGLRSHERKVAGKRRARACGKEGKDKGSGRRIVKEEERMVMNGGGEFALRILCLFIIRAIPYRVCLVPDIELEGGMELRDLCLK